jgi:hypothetical protein
LPDFLIEAGLLDFADDDVVALLQQGDALGRDFSENADGEAGPGKGWRCRISSGMPRSRPMRRTSSLNKIFERLDQLELHFFGQAADVVVRLDDFEGPRTERDSMTSG